MDVSSKKIAVICNYELLEDRVGGMDYFFWAFDKKCKEQNIDVDWFFPNHSTHGEYVNFEIFHSNSQSLEENFISHLKEYDTTYSHIITHFVELCTPFFKDIKRFSAATIQVVDHNPRPLHGYPFKKRVIKKLKGFLYSRYIDLFIGVSQYTVNEIIKDFGQHVKSKTVRVYNGVIIDDILQRQNRQLIHPKFLVASHLRESKGIQDLIAAVALLPESVRDSLKIDIYGDGPFKDELLALIEVKSLQDIFKFMGSKPNLKSIYCQYDYMLQPTHMECFSLSILESLAANVPVITTNVGGNEEVVKSGENGFIFNAKDVKSLARIIERLNKGEDHIDIDTRVVVETSFSIDNMVENHFKLIR